MVFLERKQKIDRKGNTVSVTGKWTRESISVLVLRIVQDKKVWFERERESETDRAKA